MGCRISMSNISNQITEGRYVPLTRIRELFKGGNDLAQRSILEELQEFNAALLANTIDCIDPTPAYQRYMDREIRSVTPGLKPTVGVALTCEMDTSTPAGQPDFGDYYQLLDEMSQLDEPSVLVIRTLGSRPNHECVMGDGMAKELHSCGCLGVVTDGGVRDVSDLLKIPFAAHSKGITVHHSSIRIRSIGQPIEIGGIAVKRGDVIHADSEGVIKIPASCLGELAASARRMKSFEREAHELLQDKRLSSLDRHCRVRELLPKYGFEK